MFQNQLSRIVIPICFQTQENLLISISIVSKRDYKRDISTVWKTPLTDRLHTQIGWWISRQRWWMAQMERSLYQTSLFSFSLKVYAQFASFPHIPQMGKILHLIVVEIVKENDRWCRRKSQIYGGRKVLCNYIPNAFMHLRIKGEASPSNYADWVNGGWF